MATISLYPCALRRGLRFWPTRPAAPVIAIRGDILIVIALRDSPSWALGLAGRRGNRARNLEMTAFVRRI